MKLSINEIDKQLRDSKQAEFELVTLLNWIKYEKPRNAAIMSEALDHVYAVLDDTQATLEATREALPALEGQQPKMMPVLDLKAPAADLAGLESTTSADSIPDNAPGADPATAVSTLREHDWHATQSQAKGVLA